MKSSLPTGQAGRQARRKRHMEERTDSYRVEYVRPACWKAGIPCLPTFRHSDKPGQVLTAKNKL